MKRAAILIVAIILSSCATPTPTPSPQTATQSKVGLHIVPGRRTGYGTFLQRLSDAGVTPAVVKAVDDLSPLHEIKKLMPDAFTVGRLNSIRDPVTGIDYDLQAFKPSDYPSAKMAAITYWHLVLPAWIAHSQYVDAWEMFNEFSSDWEWQGQFFIEMMKLAEPAGLKLVLYAFSTGNPPLTPEVVAEITPALRYAMAHGHYLSLHEYGGVAAGDPDTLQGSFLALRYRKLYFLLPEDARPKLIVSEAGQAGGCCFIGTEAFIEDYAWYDAQLQQDDYVVGVAAWTLGNWGSANFQDALPALADYLISFEPAVPLSFLTYLPLILRGP